ncbi:hypothetical protein M0638_23170 [Roseomonas sp. NAR14]|uniref:Uncharacterized protein n=1 Tax=Roseomonas acroporae TaxID=2937791 RepID=A0A9X1YBV6_9PROT|nr:hypothetical protein [Roseomonas acroporae]MCK8787278.1 hypothetical protein [Roseomonas acroporae]
MPAIPTILRRRPLLAAAMLVAGLLGGLTPAVAKAPQPGRSPAAQATRQAAPPVADRFLPVSDALRPEDVARLRARMRPPEAVPIRNLSPTVDSPAGERAAVQRWLPPGVADTAARQWRT